MKLKSILLSALMMGGVVMVSSCSQDGIEATYQPTAPEASLPAYFRIADDNQEFEVTDDDTQVELTIFRASTETAMTVPVKLEGDDNGLFTMPADVTFPVDENNVVFPISFDGKALANGATYELTVTVGDGKTTPYATQVLEIAVTKLGWEPVVGPKGETMATLCDVLIQKWFTITGIAGQFCWEVPMEKSLGFEGVYRLVNPYGKYNPANEPGDYDDTKDYYVYFNINDPKKCFISTSNGKVNSESGKYDLTHLGFDWGYGEWMMTGYYNFLVAKEEKTGEEQAGKDAQLGTYNKGVLSFPPGALLVAMANYNDGGLYQVKPDYQYKIIWPGVTEETETPKDEWKSVGTADFTDGWICPFYQEDATTYQVEVETKGDGLFRLVNPYKSGVAPNGYDYSGDIYVEFDVSNPNCVFVPLVNSGAVDDNHGTIQILNQAQAMANYVQNKLTPEEIIAEGINDVYDQSTFTVTFKTKDCWVYLPETTDPDYKGYFLMANDKYEGKIVMSGESASAAKLSIAKSRNYVKMFKGALDNSLKKIF